MKRLIQITAISLTVFVLMSGTLSSQTTGITTSTTTSTAVKETEKKQQEALAKAAEDQKKAQEEISKAKAEQEAAKVEFSRAVRVSGQGSQNYYGSRSLTSTSLEFSRKITENSATKEYTFDVEKDMTRVSLSISGSCKAGEISIAIIMPGNKVYSTVLIDEAGSMSWKKTFELGAEDSKDKIGSWKFKVTTTKATGEFRFSLYGS